MVILKTQNLILRSWKVDDAEELYHHAKNQKLVRLQGGHHIKMLKIVWR